jgi:hypothetical protein
MHALHLEGSEQSLLAEVSPLPQSPRKRNFVSAKEIVTIQQRVA